MSAGDFRERAKRVTPGGSQTRSKRDLFESPQFVQYAEGARVGWGFEEYEYLDWIAGLASVGLGYGNEEVDEAVVDQILTWGVTFPLPTKLEVETAELLCSVLKWPEQVRWVKTGSEATAAAMQIARAYTRREKVISIGYHGWHEAHQPSPTLIDLPWGKEFAFVQTMDTIGRDVAAVLVEPMRDEEPQEGYLQTIQGRCQEWGALFILDEVVTGFRWAIGGASEYFGVTPDLACYGKAMANGYPIAAIVGSARVMAMADRVSSTFGGECVGLAAAKATIQIYQREPVIDRLWSVGRKLMAGVPELEGYPVHPHFPGEGKWTTMRSRWSQEAAKRGVLMHPAGLNPMYAHTDADIEQTINVVDEIRKLTPEKS